MDHSLRTPISRRVAVVTGASRGIGRAIALRLAKDNHDIVINFANDHDAAAGVARSAEQFGARTVTVRGDAGNAGDLRNLVEVTLASFGGMDTLVHNAAGMPAGPLAEATTAEFDRAFAVNARGTFLLAQAAAEHLRYDGRFVLVSSIATRIPSPNIALYAASKAAGEQLVRVLAREVGHRRVTVNAVLPGPTATDSFTNSGAPVNDLVAQTPLGRIGTPEDIADVVGFLASDAARWITGRCIPVDGGLS